MAKVSIGLRGWRFEEDEVFTAGGEFRPLEEIPADPRHRLIRLPVLMDRPCDACYLIHGETEKRRCRAAEIVYGEPLEEVVLCADHEVDFLHWFREAGGSDRRGEETFRDDFHEWFAGGGRAPDGYGGLDHVDTDPDALPDPPDPEEIQARLERQALEEGVVFERIDLRSELDAYGDERRPPDVDEGEGADENGDDDRTGAEPLTDDDLDDLDLGQDYPRR